MNIIDRYIAKLFLSFFVGGLVVFVTLFIAVDFMANMPRYNPAGADVLEYYLFFTPSLIYQMLPVACLMGTIFTLSTLSKTNELIALFSSGMSLARISLPILVLVVAISGGAFALNDRVFPIFNQKKNYVYFVKIRKSPGLYSTVKTNKIWYRSGNVLFNIKTLQTDNTAQGLTMYSFSSDWQLIQMLTAENVHMDGSKWNLSNGTVTLFTQESTVPMTQAFKEKTIAVADETKDIQKSSESSDTLSVAELKKFIVRNKESGLDTLRYEVDYHAKFAFAFAAFVMSFLGIPFSVTRHRGGGTAFNIGATIVLAFIYWAGYSSGLTLGRHGALSPALAVWLPNIAMVALSAVFLVRLKR